MRNKTKDNVSALINKLRIYQKDLNVKNKSEKFVKEEIRVLLIDSIGLFSERRKLILSEEGKRQEIIKMSLAMIEHTKGMESYKKDLIDSINQCFNEFGVRKTLRITKISSDTYKKVRKESKSLRVETVLDAYDKIRKNQKELQK